MSVSLEAVNENAERRDGFAPFMQRMGAVRDLMTSLQSVTYAGQPHIMHKALAILRRDATASGMTLTDPRSTWLAASLMELEQEAKRVSPRPTVFNDQVRLVVEVLLEVWSQPPPISTGD